MKISHYVLSTALLAVLSSGLCGAAFGVTYKVEPLEQVPGGIESARTFKINARGEAVGRSSFGDTYRSLYWNSAGQITLLTPGDGAFSAPAGISDNGTAVYIEGGYYTWNAGTVTNLNLGSNGVPSGLGVNGKGQIIGIFSGVFGIWTDGVITPLPTTPTTATVQDLNDNAEAAGFYYSNELQARRAILWRNGVIEQLGTLPGEVNSVAYALNDATQVVGHVYSGFGSVQRAFIWENGVMRDLGLPTGTTSNATGINNLGQVVGSFRYPNTNVVRAFVWQNGIFEDLSPILGEGNCGIDDINDAGQMIGGCNRGTGMPADLFRLTPITTPGNLGDLSVTLTAAPTTGNVGKPFAYTAIVSNIGNASVTSATLTQTLPASGFTLQSVSANQGTCNGTTTINCGLGELASGGIAVVTVNLTPNTSGNFASSAVVASSTPELNTLNNTARATFSAIQENADINIQSSNSQTSVSRGKNITYTWSVGNSGPGKALNVILTDALPSGVSFVSATTTSGVCSGAATVTCNLGSLTNGTNATVKIVAKTSARGTFTNRAQITSTTQDNNTTNNSASVTTRVR